jgi:trans-aconitate 2-methyltransferase
VIVDWSPETYRRFAAERAQPFDDLLSLLHPVPSGNAVDLGCGPGELTARCAQHLACSSIVGIDNSAAMLAAAAAHVRPGVTFERGDIGRWTSNAAHDVVLASASLQWVPDHAAVLRRWTAALRPGGQLAVQVPANAYMPAHMVAADVAATEPFLSAFGAAGPPPDPVQQNVLEPEVYAELLHDLGFAHQHVRLVVYPHMLPSSRHVVDWVKGTTLTRFEKRLPPEVYEQFLDAYEAALLEVIGSNEPHFFPFRRILFWGRLS